MCASALATLALAALASATRDAPGFDAGQTSATLSEGCSFEMLTFYYDDDGELQCECPDDVDDDDWCFERGIA